MSKLCRSFVENLRHRQALLERRRNAGPPHKCPAIREALWHWVVDIRASLCTSISPKFSLMKVKQIAEHCLADIKRLGQYTPMPIVNKHWLLRWKADYGVCFRRPNVRHKCSLPVLQRRMRSMLCNNIRVRHLAKQTLGHDLSRSIHGIDGKPIHFNEAPHRTPCAGGGGQSGSVTACLDAAEEAGD